MSEYNAESDAAPALLSLADLADELAANAHISWREAFRRLEAEVHAAAFCARITPPGATS